MNEKTVRIAEPEIRTARDLLVRIESNPASAAAIIGMDRWQRWLLEHGLPLVTAGLDEWEWAALKCMVRHTPENDSPPQAYLFNGGPDNDPALRLEFLSDNAKKQRLTRFISKLHKLGRQIGLTFKVERAADCSKTIYTATSSAYALTMPQPRNSR
jgi:hypothetical protein